MEELIKISNDSHGNSVVSGRDLWLFLESKKDFSDWIKHRIKKYGLIEGVDFEVIPQKGELENQRVRIEYAISLDACKELSMVEGNAKGKIARKYFIDCEKKLKSKPLSQLEILSQSVSLLIEQSKRIEVIEDKVKEIEARQTTSPTGFYSVAGYGSLEGIKVDITLGADLGRKASKICKEMGFISGKIPDPRFGSVGTYPVDVLKKVFTDWEQKNLSKN